MLLRFLVTQYVRQAATQSLQSAVQNAVHNAAEQAQEGAEAQESDEDAEPIRPEIIFLFALSVESAGLIDRLQNKSTMRCASFVQHLGYLEGRPVAILETGVGQEAAQNATDDALAIHQPAWVVSAGFAGSLHTDLKRGHILMADEIVDAEAQQKLAVGLRIDPAVVESVRGLHLGRLASVERILATPELKRSVGQSSGGIACDMESLAIAKACQRQKTRLISVRIISDGVDDQMPAEVEQMLAQGSLAGKIGAAAGAIFKRPSSIKDMWALKEEALKATDRLAKYLVSMLPQLVDKPR